YLTINVPEESRVPGLVVLRGSIAIDRAEWNRAIPIDGGTYEISGKAPGHEPWSAKVVVGPGSDKQAVEVPKFKDLPKLVELPRQRAVPGSSAVPPQRSVVTPRRKIALGLALGGLVLAGAGAGLGFHARSLRDEALARCQPISCSVQDAVDANASN